MLTYGIPPEFRGGVHYETAIRHRVSPEFIGSRNCVPMAFTAESPPARASKPQYVAMAEGLKEAIFLRYIWNFVFPDGDVGCTSVHEDNVGALHLANNPATTPNSKHIDIRHHFIRERVANGEFRFVHVRSDYQHADFLTKPLHREAFCVHRNLVMNIS